MTDYAGSYDKDLLANALKSKKLTGDDSPLPSWQLDMPVAPPQNPPMGPDKAMLAQALAMRQQDTQQQADIATKGSHEAAQKDFSQPSRIASAVNSPALAQPQGDQNRLAGAQFAPTGNTAPQAAPPPLPNAAPARNVAPSWTNVMDPKDRALMGEGQQAQLEGTQNESVANAGAADEMAGAADQATQDMQVQRMLDHAAQAKEQAAIQQHMMELQTRADDLAKNGTINPDRFMQSKSSGQRLLMGIGLALGAAGAGLKGGPNQAMELMRSSIDDDIKAQAQTIENKKEGLKTATGLLADKWRLFDNKDKAIAATRQEMLQDSAATIDSIARKYQSPAIMAKAEALKGQLQQHFAAEGAAVMKFSPGGTVGGGATPDKIAAYEAELIKSGRMEPNEAHAEALRWGARTSAESPSKFYEKPGSAKADPTAVAGQALQNIDALRDSSGKLPTAGLFLQQHGGGWLPVGTHARQLDGAINQLADLQARASGARLTPATQEMIRHNIIGNGSAVDVEAGIKRAKSIIQAGGAAPVPGSSPTTPEGFQGVE